MTKAKISETKMVGLIAKEDLKFITEEQHNEINQAIKNKTVKGFYLEIAEKLEFISYEQKNIILKKQANDMINACIDDLENLEKGKKLELPQHLENPHWGNGGVNPLIENPNIIDAISICSNIAKIVIQLTNRNISIVDEVKGGVIASKKLIKMLDDKQENNYIDDEHNGLNHLYEEIEVSLLKAVEKNGNESDKAKVKEYIANRFSDIRKVVENREKFENQSETIDRRSYVELVTSKSKASQTIIR